MGTSQDIWNDVPSFLMSHREVAFHHADTICATSDLVNRPLEILRLLTSSSAASPPATFTEGHFNNNEPHTAMCNVHF
jgi:hypothetical protein